tara:strand:+ start:1298 stop:1888 length:591 start_codon:yes stop_codon:yes gene_type:complete
MKKIILLIVSGFIVSNTQYSIGIDLKRELKDMSHYSDPNNVPNNVSNYMNGINLPGFTLGVEKLDYLGKKKRINLGFEYSMKTTRESPNTPSNLDIQNVTMSLINFYTKWNFIDTNKFDFFLKVGHSEMLNYNINGDSMSSRSGLLSFGLGMTYNSKFRLTYDNMSFSVFDSYNPGADINYQHSGSVVKINLAYLF